MYSRNYRLPREEQHIHCDKLNSLSIFNDKILFKKHNHKINHIDLKKNLLMTSGDDDLIIIIDLKILKYIEVYYDIINGTKYSKFLQPLSTNIIYYGYKSFRLYIYDFIKKEILTVVNLLRDDLTHFEYNNKSNLLITTQLNDSIVWQLQDKKLSPEFNIKNSYYSIINDNKQQIISCSKTANCFDSLNDKNEYSTIIIYKYDINRILDISKERILNYQFGYDIKSMGFFKNYEGYLLIVMSEFSIEIIDLENNDTKISEINLIKNMNLKFTCFEPAFTKEIIVGYNNGDVEFYNLLNNDKNIKSRIDNKYNNEQKISKLIEEIKNNEIRHQNSVVQIKISNYYPLYVSISDEIIIYQFKNNN